MRAAPDRSSRRGPGLAVALWLAAAIAATPQAAAQEGNRTPDLSRAPDGQVVYEAACANCHGVDGAGADRSHVAFDTPLPDFSDCNFASREPDADWVAVAHEGGPTRGFARMMPAFGDLLTVEELQRVMDYIRGFCGDDSWPRGELNLPRALVTEKAYPEDEAVLTTAVAAEGPATVTNEIAYEKRFGARSQLELVVPFSFREGGTSDGGDPGAGPGTTDWDAGLGDIGVGWKRDVFHSLESGTIVSLTGEVVLPTGDESAGFGSGHVVFEPFLSVGQILPAGGFLQLQSGVELPTEGGEQEGFWRAALGRSFTQGRWGRTWSPMVEVLGSTDLDSGDTTWDLLPQFQVTLNQRQHVMANVGVRVPLDESAGRNTEVLVYILWDYFDGGFFSGW
jgi:mono/diheme cytochrome c family protein